MDETIVLQKKKMSLSIRSILNNDAVSNLITLTIVLLVWEFLARQINSIFIPAPSSVWKATVLLAKNGDIEGYTLAAHIKASVGRILAGFSLAVVLGVPLGLFMGLHPAIYRKSRVVLEPIRFIPPIAWIPMAIVLLVGFQRYIFLIWLGGFFPIWINTLVGVGRVSPVHLNVAKVFGGSKLTRIRRVVIPSVMPDILSGMRVGLGMCWMCIVAAEMIGGEGIGVGRLILKYAELLLMSPVVSGMLIIGVVGFCMNEIILVIEKKLFKWRWEVTL
jgi:ABC-type nitrate/sulfonate/bicarbonate transport system permease component